MQFTTSKLIEKKLTLSQEKDVKNLQCMVEEDPVDTEAFKDPQMKEMQAQIFEFLKSSLLGNLEDGEEDGEEEEDDLEEETAPKKGKKSRKSKQSPEKNTKDKKKSKAAVPEEDDNAAQEEDENDEASDNAERPAAEAKAEEPELIPKAHLIVLQAETSTQPNFGILKIEEGFAMGELVSWEEAKMQVQFRRFKFQEKKEPVKIPAKTRIGIFYAFQLQNIITLEHDAHLYADFGTTLVLIENQTAIIFDQSPIYFRPGDKFQTEYFNKEEKKAIKENGLQFMIKTL